MKKHVKNNFKPRKLKTKWTIEAADDLNGLHRSLYEETFLDLWQEWVRKKFPNQHHNFRTSPLEGNDCLVSIIDVDIIIDAIQ